MIHVVAWPRAAWLAPLAFSLAACGDLPMNGLADPAGDTPPAADTETGGTTAPPPPPIATGTSPSPSPSPTTAPPPAHDAGTPAPDAAAPSPTPAPPPPPPPPPGGTDAGDPGDEGPPGHGPKGH